MPFVGSIISNRMVSSESTKPRRRTNAPESGGEKKFVLPEDAAELTVTNTNETAESRRIAENTSEDSQEDRREQVYYGPVQNGSYADAKGEPTKRLDLQG